MFAFEIYNSRSFKEILEGIYDIKEIRIFNDPRLDSLCPFFTSRKRLKKNVVFNMPFNFFYSPKLDEYEDIFFEEIIRYSRAKSRNVIVKSLVDYKYINRTVGCLNSFLKLDHENYESYLKSLSKKFRQNMRTAHNKFDLDVELKEISSETELKSFYKTMSVLYIDKHKMVFQPFVLFKMLVRSGIAKIMAYKNNTGHILSAIVCIYDNNMVHYCWGISDPAYYQYSLNSLLVNELIKKCLSEHITYIDFGSTPESDKNLLFFKEKWGCIHYPVYYYYSLHKPRDIDLNRSYLWARSIYSKLPKHLIRFMMPRIIPWLVS